MEQELRGAAGKHSPCFLYLFVFLLSLCDPREWALIAALVWCSWLKGGINNSLGRTARSSRVPICLLWLRAGAPWALSALCFLGQKEAGNDCWGCFGSAGGEERWLCPGFAPLAPYLIRAQRSCCPGHRCGFADDHFHAIKPWNLQQFGSVSLFGKLYQNWGDKKAGASSSCAVPTGCP